MILRSVLAFPAIRVVDPELLQRTVELFDTIRLDFADAYLVACAERTGIGSIVSFDRDLDRAGSVTRLEP
jgi:predicted nucleic acid-binding protein